MPESILQLLLEKRFPRIWVPSNHERDQRQSQEAMGHGRAKGAILGPFRIDMDPLEIAGALGEAVDPRLIDGQPIGNGDFLVHMVEKIGEGQSHGSVASPSAAEWR